jgi:hypothetical protein
MSTADASQRPRCPDWDEFARSHEGNLVLEHDPLYALSEPIIDAIKAEAPAFFTPDQESFERDLAAATDFGFFHQQALGMTARDRQPDPETGLTFMERHERNARALDELLGEGLRRDGLSQGEVVEHLQQGACQREAVEGRMDAYVGWLVTNRCFRAEVAELRTRWEATVRQRGRFPPFPRWPFAGDDGGADGPPEFREECYAFYRRWGLDRMLTWDWPIPMEPDLDVVMREELHRLTDAGVVLFIPWYLLRGERLNLQGVVQRARAACREGHLRDWLHKAPGRRGDELGDIRYERLQWIYRYYGLALMRRYGAACRGHVQRLDRALARVIGRDEDTVKKLRLELQRLLRGS